MNKIKKILPLAAVLFTFSACYNDKYDKLYPLPPNTTCDTSSVTYNTDIAPIISSNCNTAGGCHDVAGASVSGYDFTSYTGLARIANANILLNDINWVSGHNAMPKNGSKLSTCNIEKITRWVNLGHPNN